MTHPQAVTPELLAVTDADREAACATYRRFRYGRPPLYTNIAAGRIDHDPIVQAFARHRLAERERCAKVADQASEANLKRSNELRQSADPIDGEYSVAFHRKHREAAAIAATIRESDHAK